MIERASHDRVYLIYKKEHRQIFNKFAQGIESFLNEKLVAGELAKCMQEVDGVLSVHSGFLHC